MPVSGTGLFWAGFATLAAYGGASGFTASHDWLPWGWAATLGATLIAIPLLMRIGYLRMKRDDWNSTTMFIGSWLVTIFFALFLGGLIVVSALPALGTLALASDERVAVNVTPREERSSARRTFFHNPYCLYIGIDGVPGRLRYKVSEDDFLRFTPRSARTEARIRRSWFGIHVLELEPSRGPFGSTPHVEF